MKSTALDANQDLLQVPDQTGTLAGLEEAPAAFEHLPSYDSRFSQSVELTRCFNVIDSDAGRRKVLDLARRLARGERE